MNIKTSAITSHLARWSLGLLSSLACTYASADVIAGTGVPSATTLGQRTATRLVREPAGIGHALIVPYYSTQNGNVSIFSITNTDRDNGKVVKVRIRGAGNGDTLMSFTVLLARGDVWNATLTRGANGVAELVTFDKSCTVPRIAQGVAQPMLTWRLTYPAWSAADKANQTREGYVEVLNMADIPNIEPLSPLYVSTRSQNGDVQCTESVINAAVVDHNHTSEASAAAQGLVAPTGGLGGKWLIINAQETTTFSGSMFAVRAVDASGKDARANFVLFPQTDATYTGAIDNVTSDPLLRSVAYASKTADGLATGATTSPVLAASLHDLPDLSTPYVMAPASNAALAQAAALSQSMAVKSIQNEYTVDSSLSAKTDWILSSPARRYSLGVDYVAPAGPRPLFSVVPATGKQYFHASSLNPRQSSRLLTQQCWLFNDGLFYGFFDRDMLTKSRVEVQPMIPQEPLGLCGAVTVIGFNAAGTPSVIGGSVVRQDFARSFVSGWGSLDSVDPSTSMGMPVIGSAFIRFYNPSVSPGISGNYGITFDHWMKR